MEFSISFSQELLSLPKAQKGLLQNSKIYRQDL